MLARVCLTHKSVENESKLTGNSTASCGESECWKIFLTHKSVENESKLTGNSTSSCGEFECWREFVSRTSQWKTSLS